MTKIALATGQIVDAPTGYIAQMLADQQIDAHARMHAHVREMQAEGRQREIDLTDYPADLISRVVNAERDRRIAQTFVFQGVRFDLDPASKARVTGAATLAGFALAAGAAAGWLHWHGGTDPFQWIAADNSRVPMDAQTCFAYGQAAAMHESRHIFRAAALKSARPLPVDWASDAVWWGG
jgi:hypothetical protein